MKKFAVILVLALTSTMLTSPAFAASWGEYKNARYGATADVPPGFEPMGAEATNSDGLIFRSRKGGALLTIYGADVPGGNFEAYVEKQIAHEKSYNGWKINNRTITPDWAEYTGNVGGRQLRVRTVASCGGRQAVSTKFEFNGNMGRTADRLEKSLKAGPAKSC